MLKSTPNTTPAEKMHKDTKRSHLDRFVTLKLLSMGRLADAFRQATVRPGDEVRVRTELPNLILIYDVAQAEGNVVPGHDLGPSARWVTRWQGSSSGVALLVTQMTAS